MEKWLGAFLLVACLDSDGSCGAFINLHVWPPKTECLCQSWRCSMEAAKSARAHTSSASQYTREFVRRVILAHKFLGLRTEQGDGVHANSLVHRPGKGVVCIFPGVWTEQGVHVHKFPGVWSASVCTRSLAY